jgi:predicted transglutaminase-like cysteine proteinase
MAQLVVIAAMLAGCASATTTQPIAYMALGERTTPPAGFVDFCARSPDQCGLRILARGPDASDAQRGRIKAALYNHYIWSIAFHGPPAEVRTAAAAQADPEAPAPTGLLGYALQPQPVTGAATRGEPAADGQAPGMQQIAWRRAAAAPPPKHPADAVETFGPEDAEIQETRAPAELLPLNPATMEELNAVNRLINQQIIFAPDIVTYGVDDYWAEPLEAGQTHGDCEDYVLEKRRALIERGAPESALSIAVVRTRRGEGHAVLLVATDQGELVLDSLTPWVVGWQEAPYEWVERQKPGEPMVWVRTGSTPRQLPITATAAPPRLAPAAG